MSIGNVQSWIKQVSDSESDSRARPAAKTLPSFYQMPAGYIDIRTVPPAISWQQQVALS